MTVLIDREHMRDLYGRTLRVGDTLRAYRVSGKTGIAYDFTGYVAQLRHSGREGRLEALVQPHGDREAIWLGGNLLEVTWPVPECLEGVLLT